MYSALEVSRYVIWREAKCRRGVNNIRLQKLLYFIQAQFLVDTHEPCFDDKIEAWDVGPVVPVVYHVYKYFGSSSIPLQFIREIDCPLLSDDAAMLIDRILDRCGDYSTIALMDITCKQTPWINGDKRPSSLITNEDIRKFFAEE